MNGENGSGGDRTIVRPNAVTAPGFTPEAFDASRSDLELAPLPEDSFGDALDRIDALVETVKLLFRWLIRPLAVIGCLLALAAVVAVRQLSVKPNVVPYVQVVRERCLDMKCRSIERDVSALQPVATDERSKDIVARALLPVIVHQMFAVSTPQQDQYDWSHDVLPFIATNSPAATFAATYLQKNQIGAFAGHGTVNVSVDPVDPPSEPNVYLVSWTMQTVALDGTAAQAQRSFARITLKWGTPTGDNRNGLLLESIELVTKGSN